MYLKGKKVLLRSLEQEDIEMLRNLSNSPDFENVVVGWSFPISKKDPLKRGSIRKKAAQNLCRLLFILSQKNP